MKELNSSQHALYIQAIKDPYGLSEDELLQLIVRYPFSQPLIFAYEKQKVGTGDDASNKSLALLYAPSAHWLYTFVHRQNLIETAPVLEEESFIADVEVVEIVEETPQLIIADVETIVEEVESNSIVEEQNAKTDSSFSEDQKELNLLFSGGGIACDYFVLEDNLEIADLSKNKDSETDTVTTGASLDQEAADDLSLYNDELLPYSFRWWLHKTRLEYSTIYKPFPVDSKFTVANKNTVFQKLDVAILDQQIKESIIHFQDPESKLSDQVKQRPIKNIEPKKTDKIIERFIREEPIIQAPSAANLNNENMARQSAEDNYVFVTETLANIYVEQGLFQKAITVFEKLILKYPEKKAYFAERIQELEKNI